MIRSLWTAATGMGAQQLNMDVIAHNLSNANTTGYKQSRANFEDLMYQNIIPPGAKTSNDAQLPVGVQVGMGTKTVSVQKNFTQGNFVETGNKLDLAIEGKGFFKVLRGSEEVYTRAGTFKLNEEGFICDSEGNRLQPEIAIPVTATTINIDAGGTLTAVDQAGNVVANETLNITDFPNPAGLSSIGKNYFVPTEASGEATDGQPGSDGLGSLLQGFLENANVDVVEEMVNMIVGQRAYEANSKVIKASDEMLQIANNVKA
ncbi:flagellar basal-body rod protein FlgG [Desulforhabdus amnigena]|jgi:flagellar basal-body rod protein FlgG|uniref:Flagellar basal-body rod protein FlgG n=1 Tax=Desulforhabdus amnigena TaxID=40218 RepID=A0A9W6D246_9BACT|nr:flagellar basal-body rod protein FlgG [Desulforhabdus amnigena]NLJ27627.1 flagellar basal-body rod protein FlgG [Deltaproteobacteria bacterium]GLI33564.1 flagellar basal-body rod protein FlgG [Desulforhabdus amnigena]